MNRKTFLKTLLGLCAAPAVGLRALQAPETPKAIINPEWEKAEYGVRFPVSLSYRSSTRVTEYKRRQQDPMKRRYGELYVRSPFGLFTEVRVYSRKEGVSAPVPFHEARDVPVEVLRSIAEERRKPLADQSCVLMCVKGLEWWWVPQDNLPS